MSVTSSPGFVAVLLMAAALGLVALPASARTDASSKYGGTLVVGLSSGDPDVLDPTLSRTFSALPIYRTMCLRLYDSDSKMRVVPQLAAAMPTISKDKLTYTIPLRKGVRFNDGTPFNAQAAVTSLQRHVTLPGSSRASDFEPVASFTASGPYTLVIRLKTPFTPLPARLSSAGYMLSPTQLAKLGDRFATDPVCVGPFMFDHRVPGDSVTVIKSPYFYDQKNVFLDKIVFKAAPDTAAATAALKAGDLDALDSISSTELPGVEETSSLRVLQTSGLGWNGVYVNIGNSNGTGNLPYANTGTPLASSAKLRKAFEEAIDRKALARVVFGGGVLPSCTPVSPANEQWFDPSLKCTSYDPADAKKLVAGSGISNPTVRLLMANQTETLRLAQFIQAQEAAVGINVVIEATDTATAVARSVAGNFDAFLASWSGGADPDTNVYQHFVTGGVRNYTGYSSPRLDFVLGNGRKALTERARKTLYRVAQQILIDDRPVIILFTPIRSAGVASNVTGVKLFQNIILRVEYAQLR